MIRQEVLDNYIATARMAMSLLEEALEIDPSRETLRGLIDGGISELTSMAVKPTDVAVIKAPVIMAMLKGYLDVVFGSPIYGSPALPLQCKMAIDLRLNEYKNKLMERNSESNRRT